MNLSRLLRQPVTVETVTQDGPPDDFGDPTEQTTTATFLGWLWQEQTDEDTAGGQVERETHRLAIEAAAATVLGGGDRITYRGTVYEIAGPPWLAVNPRTGATEYVLATVNRSA